jgi:hypothetical protein
MIYTRTYDTAYRALLPVKSLRTSRCWNSLRRQTGCESEGQVPEGLDEDVGVEEDDETSGHHEEVDERVLPAR